MTGLIVLTPAGMVRDGRTEIFEDHCAPTAARLILDPAVPDPDATDGLSEFSHIQVVFHSTARPEPGAARRSRAAITGSARAPAVRPPIRLVPVWLPRGSTALIPA